MMTYITIDTAHEQSKSFLAFAETLPFVTVLKEPNTVTIQAMKAAEKKKVTRHKSAKSLIDFLNK